MKCSLYLLAVVATTCWASLANAVLVATETFDGGTPAWANNAASLTFVDPSTPTEGLFIQSTTGFGTGNTLFGRDITGETSEPTRDPLVLTFNNVSVANFNSVVLSFAYTITGFDTGDFANYSLVLNGVTQTSNPIVTGAAGGVGGNGVISVPIAAGTSTLGLILTVDQNGSDDVFAFDNFAINGVAAAQVPEASAFLFGGLALCGVGFKMYGRKFWARKSA